MEISVRTSAVLKALRSSDPWELYQSGEITGVELQVGSLKRCFKDLQGSERLSKVQKELGYSEDLEVAAAQMLISTDFVHQYLPLAKLRTDQLHELFPEYQELVWDQMMYELMNYQFQPTCIPFSEIDPQSSTDELYLFAISGGIDLRPFSYVGEQLYQFLYRWTLLNVPPDRTFPLRRQLVDEAYFIKNNYDPSSHRDQVRLAFAGKLLPNASEQLQGIVKSPPLVSFRNYLQIEEWLKSSDPMTLKILQYKQIPVGKDLLFRITRSK